MTITVLLLALAHTIPVFLVRALTNSRVLTIIAAVVMCFVAVGTGGSRYAIFDLVAVVGAAYLACFKLVEKTKTIPPDHRALNHEKKGDSAALPGVLVLGAIAVLLYIKFTEAPTPSPSPPLAAYAPVTEQPRAPRNVPHKPEQRGQPRTSSTLETHTVPSTREYTFPEQTAMMRACEGSGNSSGSANFGRCIEEQINLARATPPLPRLSGLSVSAQLLIESACKAYPIKGDLVGYRRCVNEHAASASALSTRESGVPSSNVPVKSQEP